MDSTVDPEIALDVLNMLLLHKRIENRQSNDGFVWQVHPELVRTVLRIKWLADHPWKCRKRMARERARKRRKK